MREAPSTELSRGRVSCVPIRAMEMMDNSMPRHALLIGNCQYTHAPILFKCDRDENFLGQELISLGFECRVRENLRRDTAETEFQEWRDSLPRKCIALFDFSGIIRASGFRVFFLLV